MYKFFDVLNVIYKYKLLSLIVFQVTLRGPMNTNYSDRVNKVNTPFSGLPQNVVILTGSCWSINVIFDANNNFILFKHTFPSSYQLLFLPLLGSTVPLTRA